MLQYHWNSTHIETNQQANEMIKLFQQIKPSFGGADTETNGLHIIFSTPFLFQFGFIHPTKQEGFTFSVDLEHQPKLAMEVIKIWLQLAKGLEKYLNHNATYELHMLANLGLTYTEDNISDTMFYIRHAHDAVATRNGGAPLGLKPYAARYVDPAAKYNEKILKIARSAIAKELNLCLKRKLQNCGTPPEKFKAKSYTLSVIKDIFKDPIMHYTDLPEAIKEPYLEWLQELPIYLQNKVTGLVEVEMIPYNTLNRNDVIKYGHYDIIYMLESFIQLNPVLQNRENQAALKVDEDLIYPIFEMERVGFKIDKEYVFECQRRMKQYIKERRIILHELAGRELVVGQHALIKDILNNDLNVEVTTTNADELDKMHSNLVRQGDNKQAIEFIEVLQELRTLEKWYSTYIMQYTKELKDHDRLYTSINIVGAVSGRVTSNFQQFPRTPIVTVDGEELFYPRKMIIPSGGDYNATVYLDYSQIELRFQAFYTILVNNPDLNLCRAYMPYKCINLEGTLFDYNNPEHIKRWNDDWFLEEDPDTAWIPVDVHSVTGHMATGLTAEDEGWKEARQIGKTTNFAKNYGAKIGRIRVMFPEKSEKEIRKIDEAYYKAFPGVESYHQYCYDRVGYYSYTSNLFGTKYYNVSGHKLINYLIQGSAAVFLKKKIREVYNYSKIHNIKSRFQMNIHDELSWERHKDEDTIFFKFKEIMEDWIDTLVPIVTTLAVTTTSWADKKEVDALDELRVHLSS